MTASCPSCGVAVTPGYVKCPRCQAPLPRAPRPMNAPGGTALRESSKVPLAAVIAPVIVIAAVVVWLALRGGEDAARATAPAPGEPVPAATAPPAARPPVVAATPPPTAPAAPAAPDPRAVVSSLERSLDRQRLWSKVELDGARLFIRSAACDDPEMARAIDAATAALRGAGLTQLRCVAQSGAVVFQRDL